VDNVVRGGWGGSVHSVVRSLPDRNREQEGATWNAERDNGPRQWREVADRSDYYFLATSE
jgi:hypothetical protein